MPAICTLLDAFIDLDAEAGTIVQAVPSTVAEEVQARLAQMSLDLALLHAAGAGKDAPRA